MNIIKLANNYLLNSSKISDNIYKSQCPVSTQALAFISYLCKHQGNKNATKLNDQTKTHTLSMIIYSLTV